MYNIHLYIYEILYTGNNYSKYSKVHFPKICEKAQSKISDSNIGQNRVLSGCGESLFLPRPCVIHMYAGKRKPTDPSLQGI